MQLSHLLKQNIAGKLFNHIIVFLINILIVRILGAGVSGYYFNELYAINFFAFLFSMGLDYSAIAWISREPQLLQTIRRELIKVALFLFAVFVFIYLFLLPNLSIKTTQPIIAVLLFGCGNILLILFQGVLAAVKKFNQQNVILISTNLLFVAFLLFKLNSSVNIQELAIVYGVLFSTQGILMLLSSFSKDYASIVTEINRKPFYKYGLSVMVSSLVYFIFLRVDNYFVERYCSSIELSNYVQCGKVGQYFIYFSSIISSTMLPFITSENIGSSFSVWFKFIRPYLMLILAGAIVLAVAGSFLYPFVFGKDFSAMNNMMLILLPGFVGLGILTLVNAIYLGKGNIKAIFIGDFSGMLFVLIFDAIFIPKYGVMAAAIISSAAYLLLCCYLLFNLKKQFELS